MRKTIMSLLIIVALSLIGLVHAGSIYEVGENNGWTTKMGLDYYKTWSSSKTFYVGDSLVFQYKRDSENVMEVSFEDFESCNPNAALATYRSEYQPVNLNRTGHHYFICGVPGHCKAGQKLDVLVLPVSLQNTPTTPPNDSAFSASNPNHIPNPTPNPNPNSTPNPSPNPNPSPPLEDPLVVIPVDDATIASLPYNGASSPCVWSGLSLVISFILLQVFL